MSHEVIFGGKSLLENDVGFRYTDSGNTVVGIAFSKKEDVVVSFSLTIRSGGVDSKGKTWSTIVLNTEARRLR